MMIRVGALAFRVAMQRLGQRRLRETWYKLRRWLASCRAADLRKLTLLLRMTYLIESYHDKISKKGKIQKRKEKRVHRVMEVVFQFLFLLSSNLFHCHCYVSLLSKTS